MQLRFRKEEAAAAVRLVVLASKSARPLVFLLVYFGRQLAGGVSSLHISARMPNASSVGTKKKAAQSLMIF